MPARLGRALVAGARAAGCDLAILDTSSRPWASATFVGERVDLTMRCQDGPAEAWLATLPDADLSVRGCFVADLAVRGVAGQEVRLKALLLRAA